MSISRRTFLGGLAGGAGMSLVGTLATPEASAGRSLEAATASPRAGFDPWIEVDAEALRHNVRVVSTLSGGRPILGVVKNNAYGLGLTVAAPVLEAMDEVVGLAVVKVDAALALRNAGLTKPVLLMALFDTDAGAELIARDVDLALTSDDAPERLSEAEDRAGRRARVHAYLDTGMSRMGMPYHRAPAWYARLAEAGVRIRSSFMGFTEEPDFDREQLRRFVDVARRVRDAGGDPGLLHAASSNAVFHLPEAHLDQVRPGIALFGAYPTDWPAEVSIAKDRAAELRPAVRLRARVVRVERLRAGDTVSYGRNYRAERPVWVATIPAGHTDGVVRESVRGARVLIGERTYPVIGAVSASHHIVEVGDEPTVRVGDVATVLGPDHPDVHPNRIAEVTGRSVYDILMHLHAGLPRVLA